MVEKFKSEIIDAKKLGLDVRIFYLSVPKDFEFVPGEHVFVEILVEAKLEKRAYSIADYDEKNSLIELCVKKSKEGHFAKELFKLKKGGQVNLIGPLGHFKINDLDEDKNFVFLSTGTGIAPIKAMIKFLIENKHKGKIILLSGSKTNKDSFYSNYFEKMEKENSNFKFYKILSKEKNVKHEGRVQDFIENHIDDLDNYEYYICGLKEMVNDVKKKLFDLGVSKDKVFFEKY